MSGSEILIRPDRLPALVTVSRPAGAKSGVLFVHGLGGDCFETWGPKEHPGTFLLRLGNDLPEVAIATYGYSTGAKRIKDFQHRKLAVEDLAKVLAGKLRDSVLGDYSETAIVCHSLGGVLTMAALRHLLTTQPQWVRKLQNQEKNLLLCLAGVPQHGTPRASGTGWLSEELKVLSYNSELVRRNSEFFNSRVRPPADARSEKEEIPMAVCAVVSEIDFWVPQLAAVGSLAEEHVLRVALSHTDMVKPPLAGDFDPYSFVLRRITEQAALRA